MSNRDATGPAETRVILPPPEFAAKAYIQSMDQYRQMYKRSIEDPEGFWAELAEGFHWHSGGPKSASTTSRGTSPFSGSSGARRTSRTTASTGIWPPEVTKSPSSGRATSREKMRR